MFWKIDGIIWLDFIFHYALNKFELVEKVNTFAGFQKSTLTIWTRGLGLKLIFSLDFNYFFQFFFRFFQD